MERAEKLKLQKIAAKIRLGVIEGTYHAKSGHPGGSLSIADTLAYLYWEEMNVDPANPKMEGRDKLVLSKGHCTPALYAVLALRGYFPQGDLKLFRSIEKEGFIRCCQTNEMLQPIFRSGVDGLQQFFFGNAELSQSIGQVVFRFLAHIERVGSGIVVVIRYRAVLIPVKGSVLVKRPL